jgi:hypothetical protein
VTIEPNPNVEKERIKILPSKEEQIIIFVHNKKSNKKWKQKAYS